MRFFLRRCGANICWEYFLFARIPCGGTGTGNISTMVIMLILILRRREIISRRNKRDKKMQTDRQITTAPHAISSCSNMWQQDVREVADEQVTKFPLVRHHLHCICSRAAWHPIQCMHICAARCLPIAELAWYCSRRVLASCS